MKGPVPKYWCRGSVGGNIPPLVTPEQNTRFPLVDVFFRCLVRSNPKSHPAAPVLINGPGILSSPRALLRRLLANYTVCVTSPLRVKEQSAGKRAVKELFGSRYLRHYYLERAGPFMYLRRWLCHFFSDVIKSWLFDCLQSRKALLDLFFLQG